MLKKICRQILLLLRRFRYRKGRKISSFIARDVFREIIVLSVDKLGEGIVTVRMKTTNILYTMAGLTEEEDFSEPKEVRVGDLWKWTGNAWGGLEDGTSLVGTHLLNKKE